MIVIWSIGLVAGALIGCVGVGGVIVVPALVYGLGFPIRDAIASAMIGYIFTGVVGTAIYARSRSIRWGLALWVALGAGPGALAGSWATAFVEPLLLECGVGLLALFSGASALLGRRAACDAASATPDPKTLLVVGFVTGALSALTGTGGPLVLVPILIWLRLPTLAAVGLSQAVQIPISTLATLGNVSHGAPDLSGGLALGFGLVVGALVGAKAAHAMSRRTLEKIAAVVLILVGAMILARLGVRQFA